MGNEQHRGCMKNTGGLDKNTVGRTLIDARQEIYPYYEFTDTSS